VLWCPLPLTALAQQVIKGFDDSEKIWYKPAVPRRYSQILPELFDGRWWFQFSNGSYFFWICSYSLTGHSMSDVQQFLLKKLTFFWIQPQVLFP